MMLAIAFVSGEKYKTITVGVNDMVGKYSTKWGTDRRRSDDCHHTHAVFVRFPEQEHSEESGNGGRSKDSKSRKEEKT